MDFLTREFFDLLVIGVILVGLATAAVRMYGDYMRYRRHKQRVDVARPQQTPPTEPEA